MLGHSAGLAHTLLPLSMAVATVERALGAAGCPRSREAIGAFVLMTVPVYEYAANPARLPRALLRPELANALLGVDMELRYLDGRPAKRQLGVNADDVECIVAMLANPARAAPIHSQRLRFRSQQLVERAELLKGRARMITARAQELVMTHEK